MSCLDSKNRNLLSVKSFHSLHIFCFAWTLLNESIERISDVGGGMSVGVFIYQSIRKKNAESGSKTEN